MFKHSYFTMGALTLALGAGAIMFAPSVYAYSAYADGFASLYGSAVGTTFANATPDGCQVCHTRDDGGGLNDYGNDFRAENPSRTDTNSIRDALLAIEDIDSDGDPGSYTNIEEIDANAQPGWVEGSNPPGVIGDLDPADVVTVPNIAVTPTSIDFGAVTVGFPETGIVNIANDGNADLTVTDLALSGSTDFGLINEPATPFAVAPNNSVNLTVEYAPLSEGTDNGTLAISSDSPNEETVTVALVGTGVPAPVDECQLAVDPASIDFGIVEIGSTDSISTTLTNTGTADCVVEASLTSTSSGDFSLVSASNYTLTPGNSADVAVLYAPLDVGDDTGTLSLVDASGISISVSLSGSGVEPAVELLDLDIKSFRATGKVSLSRPKEIGLNASVQNNGTVEGSAVATLTGVQNDNLVYEAIMTVTDPVGGGSTKYVFPGYIPEAEGDILWTLVIADEDPDDDVATAITAVIP